MVRLRRPRFLLRTLVLLIAVVALAVFAEVSRRRAGTKSLAHPLNHSTVRIARLIHSGDWDVAPQAVPNLMSAFREFGVGVSLVQKDLYAGDPSLVYYPMIYLPGRGTFSLSEEELDALRRHLSPGGGLLFAEAACGDPAFDASFRQFVGKLLPEHKLESIPTSDELYTDRVGFDLSQCRYNQAAGGIRGYPQLEGVKIDGYWAIIYSRYGIGCALDRVHDEGCKAYSRADAVRIGVNVLIRTLKP